MPNLTFNLYDTNDQPVSDVLVSWRLKGSDRAPEDTGPPVIPDRLLPNTAGQTWTDVDGGVSLPLVATQDLDDRTPYLLTIAGWGEVELIMPPADTDLFDYLRAPASPLPSRQLPDPNAVPDGSTVISVSNRWQAGVYTYYGTTAPTAPANGVVALWVDTSGGANKLRVWNGTAWEDADTVEAGEVDTAQLQDGSVTHPKLSANAVEADNISPDEIGGREIAPRGLDSDGLFGDGVVTNRVLANQSVSTDKLQPGSVVAGFLGPEAVGTSNLQDDSVTRTKIAAGVITGGGGAGHIGAGEVDTVDLADNAVTAPKLEDGAVTAPKLATGAVGPAALAANAVTAPSLADNAVDTGAIADNAVLRAKLADRAVGDPQIGDDAVITRTIEDGAVTQDKLAAGVTLPLGDGTVTPAKLDADTEAKVAAFQRLLGISEAQGLEFGSLVMTVGVDSVASDEGGYSESEYGVINVDTFMLVGLNRVVRQIGLDTSPADRQFTFTLSSEIVPPSDIGVYFSGSDQLYYLKDAGKDQAGRAGRGTADYGDPNGWEYTWTYTAGSPPFALTSGATVEVFLGGEEELKFVQMLRQNLIGGGHIQDGSVNTAELADGAVTSPKIADDAVVQAKLADDAVGADQLAADAVVTASLVDDAVTAQKIAAGAINSTLLAANVVSRLIPAGGTADQVLQKASDTDYDTEWADAMGGAGGQSGAVIASAVPVYLWKRSATAPPASELTGGQTSSPEWNGRVWVTRPTGWEAAPHETTGNAQLYQAITTATYNSQDQDWDLGTWSILPVDAFNIRFTASQDPDNDPGATTTSTASASSRFWQTRQPDGNWGVWLPIYEPLAWTQLVRLNFNEITGTSTAITKVLPSPMNINDITLMRLTVRNQTSSGTIEYINSGYWTRDGWIAPTSRTSNFNNYETILVTSTQGEIHIAMTSEDVRSNVSNGSTLGFDTKFALRGAAPMVSEFYFYRFAAINQHGFLNVEVI